MPQPIQVKTDERGWPLAVKLGRRWVPVTVEDRWRVDDEWWRDVVVLRMYFKIQSRNGWLFKVFEDLLVERWFIQPLQL